MRRLALLAILAACDPKPDVPANPPGSGSPSTVAKTVECSDLPFAQTTPVPEASGAAWLDVGGKPALFVISDSGNKGKYAIVDADDGKTIEEGVLALGEGTDDLEGIAARNGVFYVISSPGWMRTYKRGDKAFDVVEPPYALGPVDLEDKGGGGMGDKPPKGSGMVCPPRATNCGRNYEGICLQPSASAGRCVGYAAAKADGHLYCLIEDRGKLVVQYANAIRVARPGVISDCAFSADGTTLYAGSNLFDAGNVYRIDNWQDPEKAKVALVGALGIGFPETLAVNGDVFYRMSDTGVAPSMMRKLRCPR